VVTGASKGIGLAVTRALVEAGAHVVAGSRTRGDQPPALEETGQVSFVSVDLSEPDAAEELVAAAAGGPTADEVGAMIQDNTPTGRFTTPEQVADLVVFLASDRPGNTTGSDYRIDGGFVTTL
jgi:NAD(P)-dependent dehydrogenase (short-subunit alcohol dehydrogenase family)